MINESMYELGTHKSCIRDLFEYGLQQAAIIGRENVYDFSLGNPSIPAPHKVREAFRVLTAREDTLSVHSYTSADGTPDARHAVAQELSARTGANLHAHNFFFTCGAAPALTGVLRALAVEDSEVLVITPYFPEYLPYITSNGHRFVAVPADPAFQINLVELEKRVTCHTQAVIVNSPNNPSGAVYTEQTLRGLAQVLTDKSRQYGHPIYIIADEPYRELVYDGVCVPYIPAIYPDTVICYSYSKCLSLPGERIGYFCVPDCVTDGRRLYAAAAGALRIMGHVCAPSLQQQVVGMCAWEKPDLAEYDRNRTLLYKALISYGYQCVKPQGAFYLFVKAPYGTAASFSKKAMAQNLLIVPGDDFGCPDYFRLSTCVDHDMIQRSLPVFRKLMEDGN